MGKPKELVNQRFNKLVVIKLAGRHPHGDRLWECLCDCGKLTNVKSFRLVSGRTKSCGCIRVQHGHSGRNNESPEYRTWKAMKHRCYDKEHKSYHRYGGKGILMCDAWKQDFKVFLKDMGERPEPKLNYSIDRIDNSKGYEPGNCRWATKKQQASNRITRNQYSK